MIANCPGFLDPGLLVAPLAAYGHQVFEVWSQRFMMVTESAPSPEGVRPPAF